jgi:hypothetical protein
LEELYAVLRIRDVYPGSESQDVYPGSESRTRIWIFYPSRIQGLKRHRITDPDPQHWLYVPSEERRILLKVIMEAREKVPTPSS